MTQVKGAQKNSGQLARYSRRDPRSLAERRAAFAAQMRAMALADKQAVARRLRELKLEYERLEGHEIADYDLAPAIGVKYRTYQSWVNAEVENRDGKGYDRIVRFYSRKLGRKITRHWLLFGSGEASKGKAPISEPEPGEADRLRRELRDEMGKMKVELLKEIEKVRRAQASQRPSSRRDAGD